jgi:AcrR family transcriptional regulator
VIHIQLDTYNYLLNIRIRFEVGEFQSGESLDGRQIMIKPDALKSKRHNRNYDESHQVLLRKAVEIIAKRGPHGLSLAALARETEINRTTIYYHFGSRDALIAAVQVFLFQQPTQAVDSRPSRGSGSAVRSTTVPGNPQTVQTWAENYSAASGFRAQYPRWDGLVGQISRAFADLPHIDPTDAEAFCEFMLSTAVTASNTVVAPGTSQKGIESMLERVFARKALQAAA